MLSVRKATYAGDPIGCYTYEKRKADGVSFPVETTVYPVSVEKLENKFPEVKQRKRAWYRPKEAAKLVNEPELQSILRALISQMARNSAAGQGPFDQS